MKKLILLVILLSIPFVFAATDTNIIDDTFQINKQINYAKPCFNNGSYCSGTAVCTFTIFNPDNTILLNNKTATNKGNYHNYSFNVNNIGVYKVDQQCCDSGLCGAETYYFEVTGSGYNNNFGFYILILLITSAILFFGFTIKDGWIALFGAMGLYFVGLYMLFNGIDFIRNPWITRSFSLIILGIAGYISINTAREMIEL